MRWMQTTPWGAAPASHAAVCVPARATRIASSSCSPISISAARGRYRRDVPEEGDLLAHSTEV
jgi:hypothetical protein